MSALVREKSFLCGSVLILLTNIIVIVGAMTNRAGEPDAVLVLSERELSARSSSRKENSGISLRLNINRTDFRSHTYANAWLTAEKLKTLGFDPVNTNDYRVIRKHVRKSLPKEVYIVLEFNGDAYHQALERAGNELSDEKGLLSGEPGSDMQQRRLEAAERKLAHMKFSSSRIFAIDAGLNPVILRQQYTDRSRYIITSGLIELTAEYHNENQGTIGGYVSKINITEVHVPLDYRGIFDDLPAREYKEYRSPLPRYEVEIAYGQRYEPWILNVDSL